MRDGTAVKILFVVLFELRRSQHLDGSNLSVNTEKINLFGDEIKIVVLRPDVLDVIPLDDGFSEFHRNSARKPLHLCRG